MLHSRYIVVADFPDGKTATLYQGSDSQAAEKALADCVAEAKAEAALEFCHPMPNRVRYPAREAQETLVRNQQGDAREAAEKAAQEEKAAALESQAKALLEQARELRGEKPAAEKSAEESEPPKAGKSKSKSKSKEQ